VGQFFAELGAKVIKIENATVGGDVTRQWKVRGESADKVDSAYYRCVNYGKEVRFLDLKETAAQQEVHHLVRDADLVISNFKEAQGRRLKVDVQTLGQLNPKLIYAQLHAFGAKDDRPAYDIVLQAEAGFLAMTGTKNGELCRMPVALIDLLAAHQLKEGILLALIQRYKTGQGALVTTSLYASALASLANQATNYLIADFIPQPQGTEHPNIAPYGDVFTLQDGCRIVLAIGNDRQFVALCEGLELTVPEHLTSNVKRVAHREELIRFLEDKIQHCSLSEIWHLCKSRNIPIGHVKNMAEVFAEATSQAQLLRYSDGQQTVKTVVFEVGELPLA
ncbi:MAG: CoA transferase, partial [Bacteroidota bacterium]